MGLAARRGTDQELDLIGPLRPGIDQLDRGDIAIADKKVLRAELGTVRQIEGELTERHEALARDCSEPTLVDFLRRGSGVGAGS